MTAHVQQAVEYRDRQRKPERVHVVQPARYSVHNIVSPCPRARHESQGAY